MMKRVYQAIIEMEQLFVLAERTDYNVSLPVCGNVNIKFNNLWCEEWSFWLECHRGILSLGTLEQLHTFENEKYPPEDYLDSELVAENMESCLQNFRRILPIKLLDHVLKWEQKIFYCSDTCLVEIESNNSITFNDAKQTLKRLYQLMQDSITIIRKIAAPTEESKIVLACSETKQSNSCMMYNGERNSFVAEIDGNVVDEVEVPLLPVLLEVIDKQNYLTEGQLGFLRFLSNHPC